MKVVAISGWKGSGKDMLADHLVQKYGAVRVAFADPLKDRVAEEFGIDRASLDDQARKELALEQFPVQPKDAFSLAIAKLMLGEFRTTFGERVTSFKELDGDFYGILEDGTPRRLYWTPRALAIFKGSGNRAVTSKYWVEQAIKKIRSCENSITISKTSGFLKADAYPDGALVVMSDVRFRSEVNQLREAFGKELITVRVNRFDDCASTDPSERDLDNAQFDNVIENRGTINDALYRIEQAANLRW